MGIIIDAILGGINKKAHAKIRVRCPDCNKNDFINAFVGAHLQIIEPELSRRQCKWCKNIVTLIRVKDNEPEKE